ncbi:TPA: regulator, partial [Escherichia coli]
LKDRHNLYYSKPRSEMGVTCVGRQKMKLGSKPLI